MESEHMSKGSLQVPSQNIIQAAGGPAYWL